MMPRAGSRGFPTGLEENRLRAETHLLHLGLSRGQEISSNTYQGQISIGVSLNFTYAVVGLTLTTMAVSSLLALDFGMCVSLSAFLPRTVVWDMVNPCVIFGSL